MDNHMLFLSSKRRITLMNNPCKRYTIIIHKIITKPKLQLQANTIGETESI